MTDALEDHEGTVSIGGRTITNLRFADDIDGLAGEEEELANSVECLNKASTAYSMEISAKKTKMMKNNTNGINKEIKVNGQKLETVISFKYLGSVVTDEGSKLEILSRIAQTAAALTRFKPVWNDRIISLSSKIRLMLSLVTSIFLYACESWAITAELQRRIQAMEMRCCHEMPRISYKENVTNEEVRAKIGEEDKADRGRDGKTTSGNGQVWSSPGPREQWRTGENADNLLENHLWCHNDPRG